MAVDYTIFPDENWIAMTCSDVVTEQDIRDAFESYIRDPRFRSGMHVLVDLHNAELKATSGIAHNFVGLLQANEKRRGKDYRIALLVTPGFQETLSHLFSIYARNRPVRCGVFRERDAALDWLLTGTSPPPADPE